MKNTNVILNETLLLEDPLKQSYGPVVQDFLGNISVMMLLYHEIYMHEYCEHCARENHVVDM